MAEIDLLIKLFDTLKDSMKDQQTVHNALLTNQNDIGNYIKTMPMEEIKQMLKEHVKDSSDEIDSCTETVETKSDKIMEEVQALKQKVGRMILVVIVAFTILTGSYVIIRTVAEDKTSHQEIIEEVKGLIKEEHRKE